MNRIARRRSSLLLPVLALVLLALPAVAEEFDESFRYDAKSLRVVDLIGAVTIEGHDGSGFEVDVRVRGEDASRELITFDSEEGRRPTLVVEFPVDDERHYVYPALGRRSRTSFTPGGENRGLRGLFGRDKIEVRGKGRGIEVWADVTVRVPRGAELVLVHGVGAIEARNVQGDLDLAVKSGRASVSEITGAVAIDTGSGHVEVDTLDGDLLVDTGSGHVGVRNARGERMRIDTGSGHVEMSGTEAEKVEIDTGSGHVELDDLRCESVAVDTGSGSVTLDGLRTDDLLVDTGSGNVRVNLVEMGGGDFVVDTGSGGIEFRMPEPASAKVVAETSSGGIEVDVDGAAMIREKRNEVQFEVGDATARVSLDTGSGGITIVSR